MTEKYAWYRVPGISLYVNAGKDRKVRIYCFLFCLASYLVLGTRYENDILFFCALLRTGEAVPLHTSTYAMYSYIYININSTHVLFFFPAQCRYFLPHATMLCFLHDVISAGWYQVRTYMVHNTYPTLKPRLVEHTHALFFGDVSIRNSLRSNNSSLARNNEPYPWAQSVVARR